MPDDLMKRGIYHDRKKFRWWLNSIEGAPYRTRSERV